MHYIYKITNNANGKIYIGQTNNPSLRWHQHKSSARKDKGIQLITRAMIMYGIENFSFEVIATCKNQEDVNLIEDVVINQYDSRNLKIGYNVAKGGDVFPPSPEIRCKIIQSVKEYYKNHDHFLKGKSLPESWRKNISKASIGKPGTNKGKVFDQEWRYKISQSSSGKGNEKTRRFSEEKEKEICRLYIEEKKSFLELSKIFNCYRSLLVAILERHGFQPRPPSKKTFKKNKFTKEQEDAICKLFLEEKMTRSAIARKFICKTNTITAILKRNGKI